jgi:E3 ubiquitin-protein ligase RNF139
VQFSLCLFYVFTVSAIAASFVLFSLSSDQLFVVYSLAFAGGVLCLSYKFNGAFIKSHRDRVRTVAVAGDVDDWPSVSCCGDLVICNVLVQCLLAFCYNRLVCDIRTGRNAAQIYASPASTYLIFVLPMALCRLVRSIPEPMLRKLSLFAVSVAGLDLHVALVTRFRDAVGGLRRQLVVARTAIAIYGFQFFVETQWRRLHVPDALRIFWVSRTVYHIASHVVVHHVIRNETNVLHGGGENSPTVSVLLPSLMSALARSCDNWLSLFGMASVVSKVSICSDGLFLFVAGTDAAAGIGGGNEERDVGVLSAVLFVILAFQTGLPGMDPTTRVMRLFRNLCLIAVAILHSEHAIVHGQLMALGAGQSIGRLRHVRALTIAAILVVVPTAFVYWLWMVEDRADTWLLALTALSLEIIVKVLVSVTTYALFIVDSMRSTFWNRFDDYVYVIQATGNTIEFLIGVFLFANGAWKFVFESGGALRALMMCLHAYINIWKQAKKGWQTFVRRQSAAKKIDQLPLATARQLAERDDDVCAICYHQLNGSARVTSCGHLFHGVCLRKWLYIKDACPMCHHAIVAGGQTTEDAS